MTTKQTQIHKTNHNLATPSETFMDHVRELQSRLFWVAVVFLVAAAAAYPFFSHIAAFIVAPLGDNELVYLTPGGAFGFVIQVCMYIGFVVSLPVIIYHAYKFLLPVMPPVRRKNLIIYTLLSVVLALGGVAFAYYVSLPAALYFLTSFDIAGINPMLTIDSYFSFAMAYLIAGAVLFQLPLLLLIIDSVSPLTPTKLMGYQRHIILGSVIIAAIISPTPDVLNQLLLAGPIVIMYQFGIGMIWYVHRSRSRYTPKTIRPKDTLGLDDVVESLKREEPAKVTLAAHQVTTSQHAAPAYKNTTSLPVRTRSRSIDGFNRSSISKIPRRSSPALRRSIPTPGPRRSVDGIMRPVRSASSL